MSLWEAIQESDTYKMIVEEGKAIAAREIILRQGEDRFGPADVAVIAFLSHITNFDRLMCMASQTPKAATWNELLRTP